MRVLLIGSDTTLGVALEQHLSRWGRHDYECVTFAASRWKSERHAKKVIRRCQPDLLIDARIQGAVDSGEPLFEPDIDRCHWLAKACQRNGVAYFLLSSSRVFAGQQERPYAEDDLPDNEGTLGSMLQQSEQRVRATCDRHVILRLGPVFSHRGRNLFTNLMAQLHSGGKLSLDSSQHGCPVAASDAARIIAGVLDQLSAGAETWGNYHYCSPDTTNCYEFTQVLLTAASSFAEFDPEAVTLCEEPGEQGISRRLDCSRLRNTFAIKQLSWRSFVADALKLYFDSLQHSES